MDSMGFIFSDSDGSLTLHLPPRVQVNDRECKPANVFDGRNGGCAGVGGPTIGTPNPKAKGKINEQLEHIHHFWDSTLSTVQSNVFFRDVLSCKSKIHKRCEAEIQNKFIIAEIHSFWSKPTIKNSNKNCTSKRFKSRNWMTWCLSSCWSLILDASPVFRDWRH